MDNFHETLARANELHATGDMFAKQIEPAPEDLVGWVMAEASEHEDDSTPAHADVEVSDDPELPPAVQVALLQTHGEDGAYL